MIPAHILNLYTEHDYHMERIGALLDWAGRPHSRNALTRLAWHRERLHAVSDAIGLYIRTSKPAYDSAAARRQMADAAAAIIAEQRGGEKARAA